MHSKRRGFLPKTGITYRTNLNLVSLKVIFSERRKQEYDLSLDYSVDVRIGWRRIIVHRRRPRRGLRASRGTSGRFERLLFVRQGNMLGVVVCTDNEEVDIRTMSSLASRASSAMRMHHEQQAHTFQAKITTPLQTE
jgi:hypothetical protein